VQRIGLIGITNIIVVLSAFILLPILTKNLSVNDYGIWVQINTTLALVPNIIALGLPYTMVRFLSAEKDKTKIQEGFYSIFSMILVSNVIVTTLLFIFSKNIANLLFDGNTGVAILLPLIIFLACLNGLLLNFFRTFQQIKRYSTFLIIQTYLAVVIVSYIVIKGYGIFNATLGLLIANLIIFIIMSIFIIYNIGFKVPKFKNIREYLSFGLPIIPSNLSYWIVDSSDRYVIGILLGTAFVGYYAPGYTLGNIILMILSPFTTLLPAVLVSYYEENKINEIKVYLTYSLKYFLLIAIPSAFGLSVLSKPILLILTTPEIAINGYLVTPFVTLSALLFGIYGIIVNLLVLKKKTRITGIIWVIAAILNLCLNILFVPYFGILGAAAVTLFTYAIAFILTLYYTFKYFDFDFDFKFMLKSIIASILMSLIIILIKPNGILSIITTVLMGVVIYFLILFILGGIKKEEYKFIINLISR
jgi:O-antigen/teichoic acid export membrane protein